MSLRGHNAIVLAPSGSTGTGRKYALGTHKLNRVAIEHVVEAVGGTPTMTFTIQGLRPGGNEATAGDWVDLYYVDGADPNPATAAAKTGITVTATGTTTKFVVDLTRWFWDGIAINVSVNTNVTYRTNLHPLKETT